MYLQKCLLTSVSSFYQSPLFFRRRSSSSAPRPLIDAKNYLARLKSAILLILASQKLRRHQKGRNVYLYWLPLCQGKKGRSVPIDHSTLQLPSLNELVKVPNGAVTSYRSQATLQSAVSTICVSFYALRLSFFPNHQKLGRLPRQSRGLSRPSRSQQHMCASSRACYN